MPPVKEHLSEEERTRLLKAVASSEKKLRPHLAHRFKRLQQIVGHRYGENGAEAPVTIPLLPMAVSIYMRQLVSAAPQVVVSTDHGQLKQSATDLQLAINHVLKHEINTVETVKNIVLDALLCIGIAKVGINTSASSEADEGFRHDPGQVFFDHVLPDDFVVDMEAKRWEQIDFCGDRYSLPKESVLENPDFDPEAVKLLKERFERKSSPASEDREYKSERLSHGGEAHGETCEFIERVELLDLWLPAHGIIVTLAPDDPTIPPLRVVEWDGPEQGPYHFLMFTPIPGNLMPLAPAALWENIHERTNILFNKVLRQADRQKNLLGVSGGAVEDAQRITEAPDGEAIGLSTPENVKEFSAGGYNQDNFALVVQLKQLFSWCGGNLDALGGLSASSDTVGQDKLLVANSSQQVKEMQDTTYRFMKQVVESLGHYLWNDPVSTYRFQREIAGTSISLPTSWPFDDETGEDKREGDFLQYNFGIEPYSLQPQSPQERVQFVLGYFERILANALPIMQQQGQTINMEAFNKYIAKMANMPEIKDLVIYAEGEMQPDAQPVQPGMAPHTSRTYTRVSRSAGATGEGQAQILAQAAFGGKDSVQPSQQRAVSSLGVM